MPELTNNITSVRPPALTHILRAVEKPHSYQHGSCFPPVCCVDVLFYYNLHRATWEFLWSRDKLPLNTLFFLSENLTISFQPCFSFRWRFAMQVGWGTCSESMAAPPPSTSRAFLNRASSTCSLSSTRRGLTSAALRLCAGSVLWTHHQIYLSPPLLHLLPQVETREGRGRRKELREFVKKVEGQSRRWAPPLCSGNCGAPAEGSWMEGKETVARTVDEVHRMSPTSHGFVPKALFTSMHRVSSLIFTKQQLSEDTSPRGGTQPRELLLLQSPSLCPGLWPVSMSQFTPASKTSPSARTLPPQHPP